MDNIDILNESNRKTVKENEKEKNKLKDKIVNDLSLSRIPNAFVRHIFPTRSHCLVNSVPLHFES